MAEDAGVTVCYGSDLLISIHALQTGESLSTTILISITFPLATTCSNRPH